MERRNEYWDYWMGTQFTPLRHVETDKTGSDVILLTYQAWQTIISIENGNYVGLELCYNQIIQLKNVVARFMPSGDLWQKKISQFDIAMLRDALNAFETSLSIQFNQVNTYRVTAKGTHDPRKLIESSWETFGSYWKGMSAIAQGDWVSGANCLAFALPTACGFHVVRAMEAVTVDLLKRLGKVPAKRDFGHYVELMREAKVSAEAIDIVDQIRKHHRNPLIHPEDVLDIPMAMSLYDLCRAAIVSLIADMSSRNLVDLGDKGQQEFPLESPVEEEEAAPVGEAGV